MKDSSLLLRAEGLQKSFGGRAVLNIKELSLRRGESVVLTGENGSGKTTLLKILAGLLQADSAKVLMFDGAARNDYPRIAPQVSYLHQTPYMFATTVRANIEYGLRRLNLPRAARESRAQEAMQWAGVSHLSSEHAQNISGGEQRRAALARIRALRPRLCLLDEPSAHLDTKGAARVEELISQMTTKESSVITASHLPLSPAIGNHRKWRLQNGELSEH